MQRPRTCPAAPVTEHLSSRKQPVHPVSVASVGRQRVSICALFKGASYHIRMYQFPTPQHIHPETNQSSQVPLWALGQLVLEHALESLQLRKHGKKQRVQVACHIASILGAEHVHIRAVRENGAGKRFLVEEQYVHGFVGVACSIIAPQCKAQVFVVNIADVHVVETFRDVLDLYVVSQSVSVTARPAVETPEVVANLGSLILLLVAVSRRSRAVFEKGEERIGGQRTGLKQEASQYGAAPLFVMLCVVGRCTLWPSEDLSRRWEPSLSFSFSLSLSLSLSRRVSNRFGMLAFIVAAVCGSSGGGGVAVGVAVAMAGWWVSDCGSGWQGADLR